MKMLAASGVEVMGIGPLELGLAQHQGEEFFRRLVEHSPINIVLANGSGFLPYVRLNKGGRKVLVTSVIDPWVLKKYRVDYKVSDPLASLQRILSGIDHDFAVVVIYASRERLKEIAKLCPDIDLVIDGTALSYGSNLKAGKKRGLPVPVVYNNRRGQLVCYLDVLCKPGNAYDFAGPVEMKALVDKVEPDPVIEKMVADYNLERAAFFERRKQERARHQQEKLHRYLRDNPPNMFIGDRGCVQCHQDVWEQWRHTPHARALESLKRKQRENDGECLKCHTTGEGFENTVGGFVSVEGTPWMVGVQCEACHGPGARHAQNPEVNRMKMEGEKRCLQCHDYTNDPDFDFKRRWQKIKH
jgi:predicted CXXCH cytochrome family protein